MCQKKKKKRILWVLLIGAMGNREVDVFFLWLIICFLITVCCFCLFSYVFVLISQELAMQKFHSNKRSLVCVLVSSFVFSWSPVNCDWNLVMDWREKKMMVTITLSTVTVRCVSVNRMLFQRKNYRLPNNHKISLSFYLTWNSKFSIRLRKIISKQNKKKILK